MPSPWRSPSVQVVVVVETALIAFFSFWILEEYHSNAYLQTYLSNFIVLSRLAFAIGFASTMLVSLAWVFRFQRNQKNPLEVDAGVESDPTE